MSTVLGVDLGGTTVEGLAIDGDEIVARAKIATRSGSPEAVLGSVLEVVANLIFELDVHPSALGVGMPGIVDAASGTVQKALNLGITDAYPMAEQLQGALDGLPTAIENDVRLGAIAAHERFAQPNDSLVYLGIGTGIAAGLVIDGELHRGASGMAGELGHTNYAHSTVLCHCGRRGCLEAVAAGPAIDRLWAGIGPRATDLFDRALAGDAHAVTVAEPVIEQVAAAIESVVRLFDPAFVVLGGGVGTSTPALRTLIVNKFAQTTHNVLLADTDLAARLHQLPAGWPAGAQGAAAIARNIHTPEGIT